MAVVGRRAAHEVAVVHVHACVAYMDRDMVHDHAAPYRAAHRDTLDGPWPDDGYRAVACDEVQIDLDDEVAAVAYHQAHEAVAVAYRRGEVVTCAAAVDMTMDQVVVHVARVDHEAAAADRAPYHVAPAVVAYAVA